jgi:uncharacterized protein (DUF2147 family)
MVNLRSGISAIVLALAIVSPALAADLTPVGQWEVSSGESRYKISLCGDGTELCARLTWLRADAQTKANLAMLNTNVVRGVKSERANEWNGSVTFEGKIYDGRVTLESMNSMVLHTCSGIFCQSIELNRR